MSSFNEDEIVKGVLEGDHAILTFFYLNNLPKTTNFVLKNSGSNADAEDVFQDALLLTYQKLRDESFKLNCSLATYVFAISRNLWMNILRKRSKFLLNNELLLASEDLTYSILEAIYSKEKQVLFHKSFLKLEKNCQEVLLHFFLGKSMNKIAEVMGYSESYARKKKFECKKCLVALIVKDAIFHEL